MARRLAAILAADVIGFSRMMEADEAGTLRLLKAIRREVFDPAVGAHRGRIVKTTGDGALVEFASAVDAVRCAIDVQRAMASRDAPMRMRIGINLGDIVVEGDDIFGDGVNVAARLEALAAPGGIAISGNVEEQIAGKVAASFIDSGEQRVKNISRGIRVWQWSAATAVGAKAAPTGAGQNPVIVVLPFAGPADDADIQALSGGLAEDLTAALSRRRGVEVVARSVAAGLDRDIAAVRAATKADYVLTGSLRRRGERLRVNAELVDARAGGPVWSQRYDEVWGDVFALEDTLTERIAIATRSAMNAYDGRRFDDGRRATLTNAERRAKAAQHFYRFTPADFAAAARLLDAVLADDANDAMAHGMQAFRILGQGYFQVGGVEAAAAQRALALADRAVELDRNSDYAYQMRGLVALHLRDDCVAAMADAGHALALNPQYALAIQLKGETLVFGGEPAEGLPLIESIIAADPRDPINFYRHWIVAMGRFIAADHDAALSAIERALQGAMDVPSFGLGKAAILAALGRRDAAAEALKPILARWPDVTVNQVKLPPFRNAADRARYLDMLRAAGLPDA